MFSFANTPQSIGEVLADSFKLYKLTVLKVLPIAALSLLIGAIPTLSGIDIQAGRTPNTVSLIALVLMLAVTLLAALVVLSTLIQGMYALALGRDNKWMDAARVIMGKLGSIVCVFIFSSALMVLGFMVLFFPGVFLSILLMFCMPLVVVDNCGWMGAIKKSCQLVWGHWWATFLVVLIPMLISIFLMAVITVIAQNNQLLLTVMNVVVMSFFTPFFYAVLLVQFNNLKLQWAAKPVDQ